jgi:hypothetical protein
MKRASFWMCTVCLVLGLFSAAQASVVWSADFEAPTYYPTYSLTGQGGWYHPQGWSSGMVVSKDNSQWARMGGDNGYSQLISSPAFSTSVGNGEKLDVSFDYYIDSGVTSNYIMLYANNGPALIWLNFDPTTGHIIANGTQTYDTGVAYETDKSFHVGVTADASGFDLVVDGVTIADDQPFDLSSYTTSGVIKWLAGGNDGASAVYSYMDNLVVSVVPEPISLVLLGLGAMFLRKQR